MGSNPTHHAVTHTSRNYVTDNTSHLGNHVTADSVGVAMPSSSGDVVKVKLLTPLVDIPLPISFDAAAGIADHTVANRPVRLANGYNIAPADPSAETFTGSTGFLPLFVAVQGNQKFNVYDSTDTVVGSFDGQFITTSDLLGIYTQAILVTSTDTGTVGTDAVPPVGSVFNFRYFGNTGFGMAQSVVPSTSGDIISLKLLTPLVNIPLYSFCRPVNDRIPVDFYDPFAP